MTNFTCSTCSAPIVPDASMCTTCGSLVMPHLSSRDQGSSSQVSDDSASTEWLINCEACGHSGSSNSIPEVCPKCEMRLDISQVRTIPNRTKTNKDCSHSPSTYSPTTIRKPSTLSNPTTTLLKSHHSPVEGVICDIVNWPRETPDLDWGRILFGILFMADITMISVGFFISFFIAVIVISLVASMFGMGGCVFSVFTFFMRPMMRLFGSLFRLGGRSFEHSEEFVPATYYRLEPIQESNNDGFVIKGHLANTYIQKGDRVRIWGPKREGVIRFRRGQRINRSDQTITRLRKPISWSWYLFFGLVALNAIFATNYFFGS